jgi:hypothetical protein
MSTVKFGCLESRGRYFEATAATLDDIAALVPDWRSRWERHAPYASRSARSQQMFSKMMRRAFERGNDLADVDLLAQDN